MNKNQTIHDSLDANDKKGWQLLTKEHLIAAMEFISDLDNGGELVGADKNKLKVAHYKRECKYELILNLGKPYPEETNTYGKTNASYFKYKDGKNFLAKPLFRVAYEKFVTESNYKIEVDLNGSSSEADPKQTISDSRINPKKEKVVNLIIYTGIEGELITPNLKNV